MNHISFNTFGRNLCIASVSVTYTWILFVQSPPEEAKNLNTMSMTSTNSLSL